MVRVGGYCRAHYNRWRRYGDPLGSRPRPTAKRRATRTVPGHPLARSEDKVRLAPLILWEKIGPGPAPCHWCGEVLTWAVSGESARGRSGSIFADHVNRDPLDDRPENIVPACARCNVTRSGRSEAQRAHAARLWRYRRPHR